MSAAHPQPVSRRALGLSVLWQALLILALVALPAAAAWFGQPVTLRVRPLDPRDLLRGAYVQLRYDLSEVEATPYTEVGRTVYVPLVRNADGTYRAGQASVYSQPDRPYLRGRVTSVYGGKASVEYGIERSYLPEQTAGDLWRRPGKLTADIRIGFGGRAVLRGLKLNGVSVR